MQIDLDIFPLGQLPTHACHQFSSSSHLQLDLFSLNFLDLVVIDRRITPKIYSQILISIFQLFVFAIFSILRLGFVFLGGVILGRRTLFLNQ